MRRSPFWPCTSRTLAALLCAAALSACGGSGGPGGGGSAPDDLVVFLSDGRQGGVMELWAANDAAGSSARVISGPLVATADVSAFVWSPDRSRVAFVADRGADGQSELYVVDPKVGAPLKVSGALIASGDVYDGSVAWSSDSQRLAYLADANVVLKPELFVTSVTGGALRVSPANMDDQGSIQEVKWQPGGTRIAFRGDLDADGDYAVSLVGADGSGFVTINSAGTQGQFDWAPGGARLALLTDSLNNGQFHCFSILPDGTGLSDLSDLILGANSAASTVSDFAWSAAGAVAAFRADREVDERFDLFTVAAAGGTVTNVSLVPSGTDVSDYAWAPAAALVAYRRDDAVSHVPELWVVLASGVGNTQLVDDDGVAGVTQFAWSPDGNRIAYTADHALNNAQDLFVVAVLGPAPADPQVSEGLLPFQGVHQLAWSPDSTRLLFSADEDTTGVDDAFLGIVDGGSPIQLSQAADAGVAVTHVAWSADGQHGWFAVGQPAGQPRRLRHCTPAGGPVDTLTQGASFPALVLGVEDFEPR